MTFRNMAAAAALTLYPSFGVGHEYTLGDLIIDHPISFETAQTARAAAGYLTITNNGTTDDRLVDARADFPRVEVHEIVEVDDVMSMQQVETGLVIPAGETVTLEPGGYHVMLMGLSSPFSVGDEIPLTLVFEQAGEIDVILNVEARESVSHGHEDHSTHGETAHEDAAHGEHDAAGHDGHGEEVSE